MIRRDFLKTTTKGVAFAGTAGGGFLFSSCNVKNPIGNMLVKIPLPIQVLIDDVGWWSGKDGSTEQEPYRTGMNRNHVPADYQAVVSLGRALGIRPQVAMILCEWDRENILRHLPESTWMGKDWDNGKWVGPWLDEAADIINNNKEYIEISMHGIGHEWWNDGVASRAEWADDDGIMRAEKDVRKHIEAFAEILKQNKLGPIPTSFVPTNFAHSFGLTEGNELSIAQILREYGFTYINTTFNYNFHHSERVQFGIFGVDSGVLTVDRGTDLLDWMETGIQPAGAIAGSTCGMHWANLLHPDPERNQEIVDGWVKILAPYQDQQETMLAKDSLEFQQQLVHYRLTKADVLADTIHLDFTDTSAAGTALPNKNLTIKVRNDRKLNFTSDSIEIESISSIPGVAGKDSMLYTLSLKRMDTDCAVISVDNA